MLILLKKVLQVDPLRLAKKFGPLDSALQGSRRACAKHAVPRCLFLDVLGPQTT